MIQPRWRKVLADLWSNKARTILVALSITLGVFALGSVSILYVNIADDLNADFLSSNPRSALIYCDEFKEDLVTKVEKVPGVALAEGKHSFYGGTVKSAFGQPIPANIEMLPSSGQRKLNQIKPYTSSTLPRLGSTDIFLDHTSLSMLPLRVGDTVEIILPYGNRTRRFTLAGIVHDVNAYSALLAGSINAYVSPAGMERLGDDTDTFSELAFIVSENKTDREHVSKIAEQVAKVVEKSGKEVYYTLVDEPGQHPASSSIQILLMILGGFGVMTLFLSSFLVINTVNGLLSQHVRQIGMMKAIGASRSQLIGMYLVLMMGFGIIALVISIPMAILASRLLTGLLAMGLNFIPGGFGIPMQSLLLMTIVALVVPVAAALIPVLGGTRLTVREAIASYGLGKGVFGKGRFDSMLEKIRGLPRPLLISLRNAFRRKTRLILTLTTLTLAGAIFIGVFNIQASFNVILEDLLGYFISDINLSLGSSVRIHQIEEIARRVPGIDKIEAWMGANVKVLSSDKATSTVVTIIAPPSGSTLIKPALSSGRWLVPEDENAIVVPGSFMAKRPDLKIGSTLTTIDGDKEYDWTIIGTIKMFGGVETLFYTNSEYLSKLVGQVGQSPLYRFSTKPRDAATQTRVSEDLRKALEEAGLTIGDITTGADMLERQNSSMNVLIYPLLFMACLIAAVGGLGLMGTMSLNVIERTREIGVMRSIGASNFEVFRLVVVEGMLIGVISGLMGAIFSIPISAVLDNIIGQALVQEPLTLVLAMNGVVIWLVVVLVLSALASLLPARSAVRLTVRETLAYE